MVEEIQHNGLRSTALKRSLNILQSPAKRQRKENPLIIHALKDFKINSKKQDPKIWSYSSAENIQREELSANNLALEHEKKPETEMVVCGRNENENLVMKPEGTDKVYEDTNKSMLSQTWQSETKKDDILKTLQHDQENTTYSLVSTQNFHSQDSSKENCLEEIVFSQPLSIDDLNIETEIVEDIRLNPSRNSCHGNDDVDVKSIHSNVRIANYNQPRNNYQTKYSLNADNSGFNVLKHETRNTKQPLFVDCVYMRDTIDDTIIFDNCSSPNSYLEESAKSISLTEFNNIENEAFVSLNNNNIDEIFPSEFRTVDKLNSANVASKKRKSTEREICTTTNGINSLEGITDQLNSNLHEARVTGHVLNEDCVNLQDETGKFNNFSFTNSCREDSVETVPLVEFNNTKNENFASLNNKYKDEVCPSEILTVDKLKSTSVATKKIKSIERLNSTKKSKNAINSSEGIVRKPNSHVTTHSLNISDALADRLKFIEETTDKMYCNVVKKEEVFRKKTNSANVVIDKRSENIDENERSTDATRYNEVMMRYKELCNKPKSENVTENNVTPKNSLKPQNFSSIEIMHDVKQFKMESEKRIKTDHNKTYPVNPFVPTNVKECTKSWKLKYPWVELNEETGDLFCFSCTLILSYECVVCTIKNSEDIFLVASNLLRHSVSDMHNLTPFIWQPRIFAEVYSLLKFNLGYFTSKEMLFKSVNSIYRTALGLEASESVIKSLIAAIASIVNELAILTVQKKQDSGVGFIVDPCRRLLIARYSNNQNYPEEHLITDFMKSSLTVSEYFEKNNISTLKITFLNQRLVCKNCSQCKDVRKCTDENTLPPRYPRVMELLRWLEEDPYFKDYSIFIRNLKYLCIQYPSNFHFIWDIKILSEARWEDNRVYFFILQHFHLLKGVSELIYKCTGDWRAKACTEFELNQNGTLDRSLALLSSIYFSSRVDTTKESRRSFNSLIMEVNSYCTKMLKNGNDSPCPKTLKYIELYCEELTKEGYLYGRRNISHFDVFFRPQALSSLGKLDGTLGEKLDHPSRKVFFIATRYLHVTEEQLSLSLKSFGAFLYRTFSLSHVPLCKMLELFNVYPEIKERFPLAFRFYIMISTFPFFTALVEKSFFNMWMLKTHFTESFGKELAIDLLSISQEGPIPQMVPQLYNELLKRTINSERKK